MAHTVIDSYVNPKKYRGGVSGVGVSYNAFHAHPASPSSSLSATSGLGGASSSFNAITAPTGFAAAAAPATTSVDQDLEADEHYRSGNENMTFGLISYS